MRALLSPNRLVARLFAAFLLIILLVTLIVGAALLILLRTSPLVERQTLQRLSEVARAAARAQDPLISTPLEADVYLKDLAATFDVRVLIATGAGRVLADSHQGSAPPLPLLNFPGARPDPTFAGSQAGQVRDAGGQGWVYLVRPFGPNRVLVLAGQQPRNPALRFFLDNLFLPMVEAGLAAAVLAAVLAMLIARSIARPLQQMASVADGIAHGDYGRTAPDDGPDEVRILGRALNSMSRQLQATQQTQRDFLANVSHDLKTPLTSIQGFAQAILDGTAGSAEVRQRSATIIYAEADRMRRLVDQLLDLARLDAGLLALDRQPVDLAGLLNACLDKFGPQAQAQGAQLRREISPALPPLSGDADRLEQVFTNLIDNALQHIAPGGRVSVAASAAGGWVEASVADDGPGIPPQDLERIFERFYQVDRSRARPDARGGAGLGLAICREIVEAHGGRIQAQSVVGLGARFVVSLPAARLEGK